MIEEGVFAFLTAQQPVTALARGGVLPDMAPKNTDYPRLVYSKVSTGRGTLLRGSVKLPAARFSIEAWALTRLESLRLIDAVRAAVQTWLDALPATPWGAVVVRGVTLDDQGNDYEPPLDASDTGAYRSRLELVIWHDESAPVAS